MQIPDNTCKLESEKHTRDYNRLKEQYKPKGDQPRKQIKKKGVNKILDYLRTIVVRLRLMPETYSTT